MNFILKQGPFLHSKNNKFNIELTLLITLIPFVIYKISSNLINNLLLFIIILVSSLLTSIFIDYIKGNKIKIENYMDDIIYILIVSFIIPENISYLFIFLINILISIIRKYIKFLNYPIVIGIISFGFLDIFNKSIILSNFNLYIFIIISIITILVLIINKSFKFRIALAFILLVTIGGFLKQDFGTNFMFLIFNSIYIIASFKLTPNNAFIQILYGLILGVVAIFLPIFYFYISIILISLIFIYVDKNYSYYLALKKGI